MIQTKNILNWLQDWYKSQCEGDWEHEFGINIETVDNPGWYVTINLTGTECEGHPFSPVKFEKDEMDWYYCKLIDNNFDASCGPSNLTEVLQIFRDWVEKDIRVNIRIDNSGKEH